jgi:hypothetical protein
MDRKKLARIFFIIGACILGLPAIAIFLMVFFSGFQEAAGMLAAFLVAFLGPWIAGAGVVSFAASFVLFIMSQPGTTLEKWKPVLRIAAGMLILFLFFLFLSWVGSFDFGNDPLLIDP